MVEPRLRLRKLELFEHLGYHPHPGQLLVHRSKAPRRVVACGTRWGKSTLGVHEAIAELLAPRERALGWLVAPTYDLTHRIFVRVVQTLKLRHPHRVKLYVPRDHRVVVVNLGGGLSELRAKTAENPVSLLGESLDFLIVDEAARVRAEVWDDHLASRLIDRRGMALFLSTPSGPGWFHEMYRRGIRNRNVDYESFSMPTWTNPHLPRDAIEAERALLPEEKFKEMYGAEFVGVPPEPCETCKGPFVGFERVVIEFEEEPLPVCPACGEPVDAQGKSIVPTDGLRIIHLENRRDPEPFELPPGVDKSGA